MPTARASLPPVPPSPHSPGAGLRQRLAQTLRHWWLLRHRPTDTLVLTQRNVYILPTRAGLMFGVTLLVLLIASINYQLNLGYVLTFLLAGSGVVSMHITHSTLRGLTLHLRSPEPVFAGDAAALTVTLTSTATRARHGIGLRLQAAPPETLAWGDVPPAGHSSLQLSFVPTQRGLQAVPALSVETRFPLGLFRAWAVWRPASTVLAYPRPEQPAAPLPAQQAQGGSGAVRGAAQSGDVEGVRHYRRGDPLKLVAWKKSARALDGHGELVSRDTVASTRQQLWLEWQHCAGLAPEARLSRLAAWVLAAERLGAEHGLRLPGTEIAPSHGQAQQRRCLEALAQWP